MAGQQLIDFESQTRELERLRIENAQLNELVKLKFRTGFFWRIANALGVRLGILPPSRPISPVDDSNLEVLSPLEAMERFDYAQRLLEFETRALGLEAHWYFSLRRMVAQSIVGRILRQVKSWRK